MATPTLLTKQAVERSTYAITAAFKDDATPPTAVVPNSATWSLTTAEGGIVNSRSEVVISPAASVTIVLSGADLAILRGNDIEIRHFIVEFVYDSSLGTDLPGKDSAIFELVNLNKVT